MRTGKSSLHFSYIVVVASLMAFALADSGLMYAQSDSGNIRHWWRLSSGESRESGHFSELLNRRKVYVSTSFTDSRTISEPSPTSNSDIRSMVLDALATHRELQVVTVPAQADFAVVVRAAAATESGDRPPNFSLSLDPSTVISVDVLVLVPGSRGAEGSVMPRVVWESSSSNAQVEAQNAARFTVDGFLSDLSKLRVRATKVSVK